MSESLQAEIEVGAAGGDVRYWLVAESCRQAELRLAAQAQNIAAMEQRATSILTWSTAAMVGLLAAASRGDAAMVAAGAAPGLFLAALACIGGLWPHAWHPPGYDYGALLEMHRGTELETRELIALGYETSVRNNDRHIARFAALLRLAWICFLAAPIAAGLAAVLTA